MLKSPRDPAYRVSSGQGWLGKAAHDCDVLLAMLLVYVAVYLEPASRLLLRYV